MASGDALVLSIGLIGWAAAMRALSGTWLQPAAFFPLWWCFAGIIPIIAAPNEPVGPQAIAWLICASVALSAGAFVGNGGAKTRSIQRPVPATDRELAVLEITLISSILLGIVSNVVFAAASGISLSQVLDTEQLVMASHQAYVQRYDVAAPPPPAVSQALLPFVYLAPAVGGLLFALRREMRWKLIALSSFVPAIIVTALHTTKAATLWAITLWLSGYFTARLRGGKRAVFTKAHTMVAGFFGVALLGFFFAVQLARLASTDVAFADVVILKLVTAAFGHMTVFSQWLAEYWQQPFDPTLGKYTFAGPLELFGYSQRIPGMYEAIIELVAGEMSNIYTGFRPLIEDFTIPGALSILALLGFVGGSGFRLVAGGRWSGAPLLMIAYVTIFWTPITWFWIYNSLTASVVAVGLIVFIIRLLRGARHAHSSREQLAGTV